MRVWFFAFFTYPFFAQPFLQRADSLLRQGRYAAALTLYDSLLRTQPMPDSLRLQVCLRGAEAWFWLNKPQNALQWISPAESLALRLGDTLRYAELLSWKGGYYRQRHAYTEAESAFQEALRLVEGRWRQNPLVYAALWRRWGLLALDQRQYEKARAYLRRAEEVLETAGLVEQVEYANVLYSLALLQEREGRYAEVESLYLRARTIRAKVLGPDHPDYARTLISLAKVYYYQGRYKEAETLYLESKAIWAKLVGPNHPYYASMASSLAAVYHAQGRYGEAETLLLEAKAIWEKIAGKEHPEYARVLNNLTSTYCAQGRYKEAEVACSEAKAIWTKVLGTEHPEYASTLDNLAWTYKAQGRYAEAEALYLEAKAIRARVLGNEHPDYAGTLNNLAALYRAQGRYGEAEALYMEAKTIWAKVLGTDHPEYARTLNNLANLYYAQGRYGEAEALYMEAKTIWAKVLGTDHPDYALTLHNLANICYTQGRYAKAETLYAEAKAIWTKVVGMKHPEYARVLKNLANVCYAQGRYAEAETLYLTAKAISASVLGLEHPEYYSYFLYNLARLYQRQGRYLEADTLWRSIVLKSFARIRREFSTLSTAARQNLLENIIATDFLAFQRYVAERRGHLELIELGYRAARSFKGLLLTSTEAMKHLVESSRDSALQARYRQWKRLADQYAFFALEEDYWRADSISKELQEVERAIVRQLPALKDFLPDPAGEPLFPPLRAHEALVEVVRVPPSEKTDSLLYLFYLLLPSGQRHRLELYVRAVDTLWEERAQTAYEFLRSPGSVLSGVPYRLLWSFLDSLLPPKVRVVYFAPDGVYYRVNVATLYDALQGRFLADKYEVRYVASSRRLLLPRRRFPVKAPVVIGNPDFSARPDTLPAGRTRTYRLFEGGIPPLPGAEVEARGIAQLLGVEPVVGKAATENFVKHLQSPQVLHVATHGYFVGGAKNPLLAGGLLLAQAAVWDSLFPPLGTDDGRLTAQEASNLNLLGTELVVLSACETGLGEVRGEGLYGLQRAFLEAGVQRVITALWPIDDEATRELMLSFYQNWLKRKKGEGVDEVFHRTLQVFRQKHSHPYYWGAFVVMR